MAIDVNSGHQPQPTRRTVVKGAAWATPVVAVAIATPAAAASTETPGNDEANYYWSAESTGKYTTLVANASDNRARFSTQISYRSDPYVQPPPAGILQVIVAFDRPVTIEDGTLTQGWSLSVTSAGPGVVFTLSRSPSAQGGGLTFRVTADSPGDLTATTTMGLLNPERPGASDATATSEASTATATLVE